MQTALTAFNAGQIDLLKNQIAKGCNTEELQLFEAVCLRTGLDPFQRQIYAIKRGNRMTIQTGIDGYRLIADRTKVYAGNDEPVFEYDAEGNLDKATVTVKKIVQGQICEFSASALMVEYNPGSNEIWRKMGHTMLAKCAEALALRKGFPADLAGLYTTEEMEQAEALPKTKATAKPKLDEAVMLPPPPTTKPAAGITQEQLHEMNSLLKDLGLSKEKKAAWANEVKALYHVNKPTELSAEDADAVIANLIHEVDLVAAENNPFNTTPLTAGAK